MESKNKLRTITAISDHHISKKWSCANVLSLQMISEFGVGL